MNSDFAIKYWNQLFPKSGRPQQIDVIKKKNRSYVCRLVGLGKNNSNIIAKRREREKAIIERIVYKEILPKIGMETIKFHGFVEEPEFLTEGQFAWLFFEDCGNRRYSPSSPSQRALIARWLGAFHKAAANLDIQNWLPDLGPNHHRVLMQSTMDSLPQILQMSSLKTVDKDLLENILEKCNCLAKEWDKIEAFCNHVPHTVIHGDCLRKNIHIQGNEESLFIIPFDWSAAGWGPIGLDLGHTSLPHRDNWAVDPDFIEYWSSVKDMWPMELETVQRLGHLGQLFWSLDVISWAVPEFTYEWVSQEQLMTDINIYSKVLNNATKATGWCI